MDTIDPDIALLILYHCTGTINGAPSCDSTNLPPFEHPKVKDESALHQAIMLSHVCSQWRNILLSTTAFWGRLIDLDGIRAHYRGSAQCFEELIKRSGGAPLFIYGRVHIYQRKSGDRVISEHLLRLMGSEWHRIQLISLRVDEETLPQKTFSLGLISHFQRPAPILRHFALYLSYETTRCLHYCNVKFFGDDAPALKHFHYRGFGFRPEFSWISGLHTVSLAHMPNVSDEALLFYRTTLPALKTAIGNMHQVRNLIVSECFNKWNKNPAIDILLPASLQSLTIRDILSDCVALLDSLQLNHALSGFSVAVRRDRHEYQSPKLFIKLLEHFMTHLARFSAKCTVQRLHLEIADDTFDVSVNFPERIFGVKGVYDDSADTTTSLEEWGLLSRLSTAGFLSSVTYLSLNISSEILSPIVNCTCIPFLAALNQLTTLKISCENLSDINGCLGRLNLDSKHMPCLKTLIPTLNMDSFDGSERSTRREYMKEALTSFLTRRINQELPLEYVNLGRITRWVSHYGDAQYLERFETLKVKWTYLKHDDGEFICGNSKQAGGLSFLWINGKVVIPGDGPVCLSRAEETKVLWEKMQSTSIS